MIRPSDCHFVLISSLEKITFHTSILKKFNVDTIFFYNFKLIVGCEEHNMDLIKSIVRFFIIMCFIIRHANYNETTKKTKCSRKLSKL